MITCIENVKKEDVVTQFLYLFKGLGRSDAQPFELTIYPKANCGTDPPEGERRLDKMGAIDLECQRANRLACWDGDSA